MSMVGCRETEQQNSMASQSRWQYESESCLHSFGLLYELMTPPMRAILVNNTLFRAVVVKICMNYSILHTLPYIHTYYMTYFSQRKTDINFIVFLAQILCVFRKAVSL